MKGIVETERQNSDCTLTENVRKFKQDVKKHYHDDMRRKWQENRYMASTLEG